MPAAPYHSHADGLWKLLSRQLYKVARVAKVKAEMLVERAHSTTESSVCKYIHTLCRKVPLFSPQESPSKLSSLSKVWSALGVFFQ